MVRALLTVEEVAERLKVHHSTVRRWLRTRELKGYPLGDRAGWRIGETDLLDFLERQREAADGIEEIVQRQGQAGVEEMEAALGHTYSRDFIEAIRDTRVHLARAQLVLDRMVAEGRFFQHEGTGGTPSGD